MNNIIFKKLKNKTWKTQNNLHIIEKWKLLKKKGAYDDGLVRGEACCGKSWSVDPTFNYESQVFDSLFGTPEGGI